MQPTPTDKLEDQQKQNEEWQAKQHQMFLRQEEIRKQNEMDIEQKKLATLEHQAKLERETAMQRARAEGTYYAVVAVAANPNPVVRTENENHSTHHSPFT